MYIRSCTAALPLLILTARPAFSQTSVGVTPASSAKLSTNKRSDWEAKYTNYMNGPTFSQSSGSSVNHFFWLKYRKNDWAVGGVFRPDTLFEAKNTRTVQGDSFLTLTTPDLFKNQHGVRSYVDIRYALPLSEESQRAERIGMLEPRFYTLYNTGNFEFSNIAIPKVFINKKPLADQKMAALGDYLNVSYRIVKQFCFDFGVYPVWTFSRGSGASFNNLLSYPGFTVDFSEKVALSAYVETPLLKLESKTTSLGALLSAKFL